MCCLGYEEEAYEQLNRITPRPGSAVNTPRGKGVVQEANLLTGKVKVRLDDAPDALPETFDRADLTPGERRPRREREEPQPAPEE